MALTKVTGGVVSPSSDYAINNVTGVAATFTGNVSIGGTLTYQDVSNIDAVGIITAQKGIQITGDGLNVTSGIATFASDIHVGENIAHLGDTDTKIVFTDNKIDLHANSASRMYISQHGAYLQTTFPLAFLASTGPSPAIKSGGTNNQDLLLTTGTGNPTRLQVTAAGLVGIGTNNPRYKLQITGDAALTHQTGNTITNGVFMHPGDTGSGNRPYIELKGAGSAGLSNKALKVFYNNGSNESFYVDYEGNVSGGHFTSGGNLTLAHKIVHAGDTDTFIEFDTNTISFDTGGTNYLKLHNYASVNFIEVGAAADVSFADSGSDTRYVLIGDASASSTGAITMQAGAGSQGMGGGLTLYSHANTTNAGGVYIGKSQGSSGSIIFGNGGLSPANEYLRITSSGVLKLTGQSTSFETAGLTHHTNNNLYIRGGTTGLIMQSVDGNEAFVVQNDYVSASTGGTERLRINSSGKTVFSEEIETPQDYPNYRPTLDFNFVAVKKLDPRIIYERTGPASYVNESGKVVLVGDNTPRFDHDAATGECKGLLIEEGRKNYLENGDFVSSYGSGNFWLYGVGNDVFSASSGSQLSTNPDGSSPAYHYAPSSTAGYHRFYRSVTVDTYDTEYVASVFVKRVTAGSASNLNRYFEIELSGNLANNPAPTGHSGSHGMSSVTFDLQDLTSQYAGNSAVNSSGIVGDPKIEDYGNGWYR